MDERTDRPYFIGPFRPRPGVQKPIHITIDNVVRTDSALKASWIVKRTKLYQFDILLILKILWNERTTPNLKNLRIRHLTIPGSFPLFALLSISGTVFQWGLLIFSGKTSGFNLTFQKSFMSFPNENEHKTDLRCRPKFFSLDRRKWP